GPAAERLSAAYRDWQNSLQTRLDYPETHMVLGGFALTLRNFDMASAAFGQVTRLDPQRVDAWVMQIRIAAAQGQRARATQLMQEAQSFLPDDPGLAQLRRDLGL
ncbi:MAG: hypothetical protein HRU31_19155, partial [Rhodobacteraceae bacterium]|nr:hypothetical protein [Paracoccaceae bacterium]